MAVGFKATVAQSLLDAYVNNTAYTGPAAIYAKLHVADPGAAGTSNAATETTRQAVSWGAASSTTGIVANDTAVTWTNIAGSQDATHFSLWDNVSAGNFLGSGTITANPYTAGDTYTIATGAITWSLNIAA